MGKGKPRSHYSWHVTNQEERRFIPDASGRKQAESLRECILILSESCQLPTVLYSSYVVVPTTCCVGPLHNNSLFSLRAFQRGGVSAPPSRFLCQRQLHAHNTHTHGHCGRANLLLLLHVRTYFDSEDRGSDDASPDGGGSSCLLPRSSSAVLSP